METLKFKTNIKCAGCIATVTPFLDTVAGKDSWSVDTLNPDKTLVINTDKSITGADVIQALQQAGYKAENI
ncbi:MAG TPA: heavy metal transport/detoxification protein [Chitinophaga sp.]|uniref:heavy-metal-associated domain-containing protein n=1 Tax=Chitinophaga sp. TaxID=1869181 RepID=UPI002F949C89